VAAYADRVEGELSDFVFRSEDGGFAVVHVTTATGEVTALGALAHIKEGQRIVATGQWQQDLRFGPRFKVETVLVEEPRTLAGLERYLQGAVQGVGPELARRIVDHFGLDTLRVLEGDPMRLCEVDGIGPKTREKIVATWVAERAGREVEVTLRGHGIGPAAIRRVLGTFGVGALDVVTRQPYRLVEVQGIGFRTADTIARAHGVSRTAPERVQAAVDFALKTAEEEGSCFLPEAALVERLVSLDVDRATATAGVDAAASMRRVIRHAAPEEGDRPVYRAGMDELEARVARRVAARSVATPTPDVDVAAAAQAVGIELAPGQNAAVAAVFTARIVVITGGPGTGKTTIVRVLAELARRRAETWAFASPTGRASRRLSEACGQEAKTLHRLLEWGGEGGFGRDASRVIEADCVVVDEASMVDLALFDALLDALGPRARLVLVGDVDQLPSVGPGQVLRDLILAGNVPVARLTDVYRQAATSAIVRNAHRMLAGEVPVSAEKEEGARDCFVLPREDAEDLARLLVTVVTERLPANGFDPKRDVQVLTPMHAGPLGTIALNQRLGAALNPVGPEIVRGNRRFRVGDRIIQTKNDYDLDVFNGDVGRVVGVTPSSMEVDFDGRVVPVPGDALDTFDPAWAISIHKSQGSEYPAVVMVLHPGHFVMLRRNLVYTALTRARRFAVIVASPRALRMAVTRAGVDDRHTGLARRLGYLSRPPEP
jgi:exodeoxyribonuclease V alpha subunit